MPAYPSTQEAAAAGSGALATEQDQPNPAQPKTS